MIRQQQQQQQTQKLTPQQIQLIKLLQIPTVLLEQRIKEELEVNPALEEWNENESLPNETQAEETSLQDSKTNEDDEVWDKSDWDYYLNTDENDMPPYKGNNYQQEEPMREIPVRADSSFQENLLNQLHLLDLPEEDMQIGEYIIGNLDETGYFRMDLRSLSDNMLLYLNLDVSEQKALSVLQSVQKLDPAGIAARDLQECLILQVQRLPKAEINEKALEILNRHFTDFGNKKYAKIIAATHISEQELIEIEQLISKLNPKPCAINEISNPYIIPDFIITNQDGELVLQMNNSWVPEVRINRTYADLLHKYSQKENTNKENKEAFTFVKQKIEAAHNFIDAIKQRNQTLLHTMEAIMQYQYDFFITGNRAALRPMKLEDIAKLTDLDISTVSRVVNSKYVQCLAGVFLLKDFFSKSVENQKGEVISNKEMMYAIQDIVAKEDPKKPFTDDQLVEILTEKGYNIARRTVAKYRENLQIPVARLRKRLI